MVPVGGSAGAWAGWLLAIALPFGVIRPIGVIGELSVSAEKLLLVAVSVAWLLQGSVALPTLRELRIVVPSLLLVLVTLLSASIAGSPPQDALGFASRLLAAAFSMLIALRLARDNGLVWAIVIGAGLSAILGVGEALGLPWLNSLLALFKVAPTRVGGELRVSASFQYATIAAMYFEMVTPLAIALAATAQVRWQRTLATAIAMLCTTNVVLSLTRAGMLTLAVIIGVVIIGALTNRRWRGLIAPSLACAGVLVVGTGVLLLENPVFDMRLVSESDAEWYGAAYSVPPALSVGANQSVTVTVEARNEGRITWRTSGNDPFELGYRWLTLDRTGVFDVPTGEIPLPHEVEPGNTVRLEATLTVPNLPAGTYTLDWSMLQRNVLLFYERGWADAETRVEVAGSGGTMPPITPRDDWISPWAVGRLDLWGAAAKLFAAHPLLGIGPDNFRHLYGAVLGLDGWDERVQANNVYLEVLADLGVIGFAVFIWVIAAPLLSAARAIKTLPTQESRYLTIGVVIAVTAFLIHGFLDSFVSFTPIALLLWMSLGLAQAQKPHVSGR